MTNLIDLASALSARNRARSTKSSRGARYRSAGVRQGRPSPLFSHTNMFQFLSCVRVLSTQLTPTLLERTELMEMGPIGESSIDTETMFSRPLLTATGIRVDAVSFRFAVAIASFVACVHCNRWPRTPDHAPVRELLTNELAQRMRAAGGRPHKAAFEQISATVQAANATALLFWTRYYDGLYGAILGQRSVAPGAEGRPGTRELQRWLDDPRCRPDNPMSHLQTTVADAIGARYEGSNVEANLEGLFGPSTRDLIRRAVVELGAPLDH
jgi:hypothetical protein